MLLHEGRWLRDENFARGALVAYRIESTAANGYVIASGYSIDRIVGVPGDRVKIEGGQISVNGLPLPPEQCPLCSTRIDRWETTVGKGSYLILPTCLNLRTNINNVQARSAMQRLLQSVSIVRYDNILGRVVYRLRPLDRMGPVR